MRRLQPPLLLLAAALLGAACSSPGPFTPDGVIFWQITSSNVFFTACPDSTAFTAASPPLDVVGRYLVYRVSPDGRSAVQQDCDRVDPTSCLAAPDGLIWSIEGTTLRASTERRDAVGTTTCTLLQSERWTMDATGQAMLIGIANTLSLLGLPAACDPVEAAAREASPNGHGLAGCVITYRMEAILR